jgi:hypothetical protein
MASGHASYEGLPAAAVANIARPPPKAAHLACGQNVRGCRWRYTASRNLFSRCQVK